MFLMLHSKKQSKFYGILEYTQPIKCCFYVMQFRTTKLCWK